jgi:hypothetical protein
MGLVDFMQQLQDQDADIIYSEEPDQAIRVIPPEKDSVIKVIPPTEDVITTQPIKIKLKITQPIQRNISSNTTTNTTNNIPIINISSKNTQPVEEKSKVDTVPVEQVSNNSSEETVTQVMTTEEELFIKSGTESSKKSIWFEYYNRAKSSRKRNIIVEKMKIGRFTITPDNKVLILPDYDVVNKDPDDILKDKWF